MTEENRVEQFVELIVENIPKEHIELLIAEQGSRQDLVDLAQLYKIESFEKELDKVLTDTTFIAFRKMLKVRIYDETEKIPIKEVSESVIDRVKGALGTIKRQVEVEEFDRSVYGFISLNNGAGATTVAVNTAVELSKKYRVCILDCDFLQPNVGINLSTPVLPDKSILNHLNSSGDLKDCILDVKNNKNLWLVSTSPVDFPGAMASEIGEKEFADLINYLKKSFQYLILNMSYEPISEWFVYSVANLDKGYFVWDEQIDNKIKTEVAIDYVNQVTKKAQSINNVIINKRTNYTFPYSKVEEAQCNLIAEIPYLHDIFIMKNEGKIFKSNQDKRYAKSIKEIVKDIEKEQNMGGA